MSTRAKEIRELGNTGYLEVDANGNVGIGTASPARSLHVVSSTVGGLAAFEGTNNGVVIQGHSSDTNIVEIVGYKQSNATYADVHIRANVDGLIVKEDSGNVGIGIMTPTAKLDVNGLIQGVAGAGSTGGIKLHTNSGINVSANYMSFHTGQTNGFSFNGNSDGADNNNPLVVINSSGRVGIGTTSPGTPLHIDNGNVDGTILRLTNEEVGLNVTVDGGTGNYSGSTRTVTFNATRFDGGDEPALRLAGQDRIEFAADANSVKMTLDKNSGFNNSSQLNLHSTYLRRGYEKITEWTAFTHCTTPDNANFIHIRTPIITDTASSGNISAYQPVAIEIYGFHNYAAENFHDATVVVNTPSNGSFQVNTRANNNNHSSMTVYRSNNTYNGYNRVCISLPKSGCCCVGALWIRFRWWNGLPTDNYAWGHTGTYASTDGF